MSTPQEKAKELVDKFSVVGLQQRNEGIECALIAVDEILKIIPQNEYMEDRGEFNENRELIYWKEVKEEIEKL